LEIQAQGVLKSQQNKYYQITSNTKRNAKSKKAKAPWLQIKM